MVLWLVGAELELVVAGVADGSREASGVLAVVGVLGQKKLALDHNRGVWTVAALTSLFTIGPC